MYLETRSKKKILIYSNEFLFFQIHINTSNSVFILYKQNFLFGFCCLSSLLIPTCKFRFRAR